MNEDIINKIKASRSATREKRKHQTCKTYELKINTKRLNTKDKEKLYKYFLEAKYLYNYILSTSNVFEFDSKTKNITRYDKDKNLLNYTLEYLPASLRQSVLYGIQNSIKSLSRSKASGNKVGRLKFKSEYKSIELSQYSETHYLTKENLFKVAGIKRHLHVYGLKQIPKDVEFANAKLIKRENDFYIRLTTYQNKKEPIHKGKNVGIDFGIKHTVTTSDNDKYNVSIRETERLKRLQRKLSRKQKRSNNRYKLQMQLRKEYHKISNRKNDFVNKLIHDLYSKYDHVCIQNDDFRSWHKDKRFSTKVQHSILGLLKRKLLYNKNTKVVDQFVPTTKTCTQCLHINDVNRLEDRVFVCENCKYEQDRDIKAANLILQIGMGHIEFKPADKLFTRTT